MDKLPSLWPISASIPRHAQPVVYRHLKASGLTKSEFLYLALVEYVKPYPVPPNPRLLSGNPKLDNMNSIGTRATRAVRNIYVARAAAAGVHLSKFAEMALLAYVGCPQTEPKPEPVAEADDLLEELSEYMFGNATLVTGE